MRSDRCARARSLALATVAGLLLLPMTAAVAAPTAAQRTWNFDQVNVPAARSAGSSGEGVLVAVLDSWIDPAHQDFEGRVLAGADCVGGTCKPGPPPKDSCDHGTHVAGTVASTSFGVAPRAKILPVRVLTYDPASKLCVGNPEDVAAGIRWAVRNKARVINLSLGPDVPGLTTSPTIPTAVKEAAAADVVVVFSAGNSGAPMTSSYGGDALVVAATARSGGLASYSQRGDGVDLAAPGGDPKTQDSCTQSDCITSLYPGNRYAVAAGTSMAAPHVAGIAALLLGQQPTRTRSQVFDRLKSTARPLAGAGSGLVNAAAALGVSSQTEAPRASTPPSPVTSTPSQRSSAPTPASSAPASAPATVIPAPTASPVLSPPVNVPASPVPIGSPTPLPVPVQASPPTTSDDDVPPLPLVVAAAALALLTGTAVLVAFRRTTVS